MPFLTNLFLSILFSVSTNRTVDIGLAIFGVTEGHQESDIEGMCADADNVERAHTNAWALNVCIRFLWMLISLCQIIYHIVAFIP